MFGIGQMFIQQTKHPQGEISDQMKGLPQPPLALAAAEGQSIFDLPHPQEITVKSCDLRQTIEQRTSIRDYAAAPLTLSELSFLLWCTQGVKKVGAAKTATLRTVPSAGARHALETYLLINRVTGLSPGLYRYLPLQNQLVLLNSAPGLATKVAAACLEQSFVADSAVTFIWAADLYRMKWRYGERGYRYLFLDAGHVCQNLYLSSPAVDCGVCAIAAFFDDQLDRLLGLKPNDQFTIYAAAVGKSIPDHSAAE